MKNNIIVSPMTKTKIGKAYITNGTIVVFPTSYTDVLEISLNTLRTLFGDSAFFAKGEALGRPCLTIQNASFCVVASESIGADVTIEVLDNNGGVAE